MAAQSTGSFIKKEILSHDHDHAGPPDGSRVVVVAVDGSHHSEFALDFYLSNLKKSNDYVVLLTSPEMEDILKATWSQSGYTVDTDHIANHLAKEREKVEEKLHFFKEKMLTREMRGKVKAVSSHNPGDAICKGAEEEDADFIVIGCRGLGAIRRTFLGSVSDYVLHHSHIPVVICRHKHSHEHHANIGHKWNL
ncbi:putative universal stress protein SAUSA300_1656 [Haliotis rufescens]|uniref:putative universal stress protein SAUSA300_1656 n=1 Tax=Haliotis rufescens TaxID=6454 RepID=UPI001EAF8F48|nr:putative universal stress protein SAUSA300_1656 [Haliotis rufescens]